MPIPQQSIITGRLDDTEGLRLCILIPIKTSARDYIRQFSRFGPIDHIQILPMKIQDIPGTIKLMAFVKYFNHEDAASAMDNCDPRYGRKWATRRFLSSDMENHRTLYKLCGKMIDIINKEDHAKVCKIQNGLKQITHRTRGKTLLYKH